MTQVGDNTWLGDLIILAFVPHKIGLRFSTKGSFSGLAVGT